MSGDLKPYQKHEPLLTAGARFIRGFKRIGLAAGALVFLGGLVVTFIIASDQQQSAQRKFQQASCIAELVRNRRPLKMTAYDQTKIDFEASGCPGYSFYGKPIETILASALTGPPAPLEYAVEPFFIGLAISVGCGAIIYLGFWMIGWLCAGFTRD